MDVLLVKRAQKNDRDAFVALIEKHKTGLYKVEIGRASCRERV